MVSVEEMYCIPQLQEICSMWSPRGRVSLILGSVPTVKMSTGQDRQVWRQRSLTKPRERENTLTHSMLRLLSSNAQGSLDFWKPPKPYHVGIHGIALTEYCQINTHVPGFQTFFTLLQYFVLGKLGHQQHKD